MKTIRSILVAAAVTAGCFLLSSGPIARGATIAYRLSASSIGSNDVSNLTGSATDAGNVNTGNDTGTYVAYNQPTVGQTFTTGSVVGGYRMTSITLQNVSYGNTYYNTLDGGTFNVRVTLPSGGTLTVLRSETVTVTGSETNTFGRLNFPSVGNGTGRFITFTLATPLQLNPNTLYGFDIGSTAGIIGTGNDRSPYFESNGNNTAATYSGGSAYVSGSNGSGNTTLTAATGDRVFIVALMIPEPASFGILTLCGMGFLARRRRGAFMV